MIEIFAVDPEIPAHHPEPDQFLATFAMSSGRLLADYPARDWAKLMVSQPDLSVMKRKELEVLASRLQTGDASYRAIHLPGVRYDSRDTWINNALDQKWAFDRIVSESERKNDEDTVISLDACRDWRSEPSKSIKRTPDSITRSLLPVLRHAREIRIVDSYFRPIDHVGPQQILTIADRYLDVIRELLGKLSSNINRKPAISIHARFTKELPSEVWRRGCEEHLSTCLPEGWCADVLRWKQRSQGERLHDRFILTDLGGVGIHGGLDCVPGGHEQTTSINLMGSEEWKKRWADYDPCPETIGNGPFALQDRVEVRGRSMDA